MNVVLGMEVSAESTQQVHTGQSRFVPPGVHPSLQAPSKAPCLDSRFEISTDGMMAGKAGNPNLVTSVRSSYTDHSEFLIACLEFERVKQSGWSDHLKTTPKWM